MTILEKIKNKFPLILRKNIASINTYEAIKGTGALKYQDRLVAGGYHDYWDNFSRKEVVLNDAIGERITKGFLKHVFQKLPKFLENDEVGNVEYIMDDVRQAIDTLNLKPKFITTGINLEVNGWSLVQWNPLILNQKIIGLSCKIFGYEECHPRYWFRSHHPSIANVIQYYKAIYIPRPLGMESIDQTLAEERHTLKPTDPLFQHLTAIDFNYGYGYAKLQPIWDAITKLRERSDSDHFLNSNFMDIRYPQSWTQSGKGKKFVEKARKATKRRGLATEAVTNPHTNEDTGLPSVQYRPWGQGTQGQPMDKNRASAYLDGEWLRLLVNLGYSQIWAGGSTAGQETGSEINLTRDDRADISAFTVLESVFKKMLKRLAELGVMTAVGVSEESINRLIEGNYRMVCWLTWEYNDKAVIQQAQLDHEMEMKRGESDDRNAFDNKNNTLALEDKRDNYTKEELKQLIREKEHELSALKQRGGLYFPNEQKASPKEIREKVREITKLEHLLYKENTAYNRQVETMLFIAIRFNRSMPMTPVKSSWIKSVGFDEGSVYMQVHDQTSQGIDTYEYNPGDTEGIWQEWIDSGSKGGFWWDYIRDVYSPAFKHGRPPDYLSTDYGEELGFTQPEATREFKMYGEQESGTIGVGTSREPYPLPQEQETTPGMEYNPSSLEIPESTTTAPSLYTPGRIFAPETVSGSKKTGPGRKRSPGRKKEPYSPIVPYNPTLYNSALVTNSLDAEIPKMLRLGKQIDWNMSKTTAYNFLNLVKHLNSHLWRCNSIAIGNEMSFDMPLYYENPSGGVDVEYACPEAFKDVKNHKGNLYLYSNLGHSGEKHVVGSYERIGWDEEKGKPILKLNYEDDKIFMLLKAWDKENSNIMKRMKEGKPPEISTEYYCKPLEVDDKVLQTEIHNSRGEPIYEGIAIVDYGNCSSDHCQFTLIEA